MPDLCFSEISGFSGEGLKERLEGEAEKMFGALDPDENGGKKANACGFHRRLEKPRSKRARILFQKIAAWLRRPEKFPPK